MTERPTTWKNIEETLDQIMSGKIEPPNQEEMTNDQAVYHIATFIYPIQRGQFRDKDGHSNWATYFLGAPQNGIQGRRDGTGFVLHYVSGNAENGFKSYGKATRFAICKHKKTEEGHSPNHIRGWHPGHCEICGIDMSVDSGD